MSNYADTFSRNLGALSSQEQQALQYKRVGVIGCGGLGGHVIEQLVRIGVGQLHCFDPDAFSPSNCNRQLNALATTMGRNKAIIAANRAASIHPFTKVIPFASDFRAHLASDHLTVDVVVDCLDSILARRDLAELCTRKGMPLVHGAVNGWCGQVGVQMPGDDLLARLYPQRLGENDAAASPPSVLAFTVAVVASLQACETVRLLLAHSSSLRNRWLQIDLKYGEFQLND